MKIPHILLIILVLCAAGFLLFAGINESREEIPPEEPSSPEDDWAYPISFLKIDAVPEPNPEYRIIILTENDRGTYPVLFDCLENSVTYLHVHPTGEMTAEEYYAIQDTFGWGQYASYNGTLHQILIGAIGVVPPTP